MLGLTRRPGSFSLLYDLLLALIFRGPNSTTIPAYSKRDRGDEPPERVLEMTNYSYRSPHRGIGEVLITRCKLRF